MDSVDPIIATISYVGSSAFAAGAAMGAPYALAAGMGYTAMVATIYGGAKLAGSGLKSVSGMLKGSSPSMPGQRAVAGVSQGAVQSSEDMERKRLVAAMGRKSTFITGGTLGQPSIGKANLLSGAA